MCVALHAFDFDIVYSSMVRSIHTWLEGRSEKVRSASWETSRSEFQFRVSKIVVQAKTKLLSP